jgi:hypothetical protein
MMLFHADLVKCSLLAVFRDVIIWCICLAWDRSLIFCYEAHHAYCMKVSVLHTKYNVHSYSRQNKISGHNIF